MHSAPEKAYPIGIGPFAARLCHSAGMHRYVPHTPSRRSDRKQAAARLHQMACLDFNGPQCIAPVLQQLHRLIGFDSAGYFYPGSDGELQAHLENPALAAAMPDYFDPRMLASESQVFHRSLRRFGDVVRHEHGPHVLEQLIKVPYAALLKSDYYNVVLRPAQVSNWMSLVLRTPQSLGLGMLFLYRHGAAPPFGRQETAVLAQLEPCLARLLQPGELDAEDSAVAESGLLIATPLGRLLWISPEAERLMPLAFGWRWHHAGAGARQLPLALQLLLQRLHWAWQGEAGHLGPVLPQMEWRNAGAGFPCAPPNWRRQQARPRPSPSTSRSAWRVPRGSCRHWSRLRCPRASLSWPTGSRAAGASRRSPRAWVWPSPPSSTTAARYTNA